MILESPEFKNNEMIPEKFTCEGDDVNPKLVIKEVPEDAESLALIIDDPDAPGKTWVHWIVYDMPVISEIEENSVPGKQGINDFAKYEYGGPCPPAGTHHYHFKIYALDKKLELEEGKNKSELENVMHDSIIDTAELVGLYKR